MNGQPKCLAEDLGRAKIACENGGVAVDFHAIWYSEGVTPPDMATVVNGVQIGASSSMDSKNRRVATAYCIICCDAHNRRKLSTEMPSFSLVFPYLDRPLLPRLPPRFYREFDTVSRATGPSIFSP